MQADFINSLIRFLEEFFNSAYHKIVWNDFEQALLDPQGEGHDCMDAGDRATQDAVAEEACSNLMKNHFILEIASPSKTWLAMTRRG